VRPRVAVRAAVKAKAARAKVRFIVWCPRASSLMLHCAARAVKIASKQDLLGFEGQIVLRLSHAPVAQLDRAAASEAVGQKFESSRAHHFLLSPLKNILIG
jgi:hypothetical protein